MSTFKPGDTVRTRHGDVVRLEEFIDNDEIPMWRCDNGCVYIEPDIELDDRAGTDGTHDDSVGKNPGLP